MSDPTDAIAQTTAEPSIGPLLDIGRITRLHISTNPPRTLDQHHLAVLNRDVSWHLGDLTTGHTSLPTIEYNDRVKARFFSYARRIYLTYRWGLFARYYSDSQAAYEDLGLRYNERIDPDRFTITIDMTVTTSPNNTEESRTTYLGSEFLPVKQRRNFQSISLDGFVSFGSPRVADKIRQELIPPFRASNDSLEHDVEGLLFTIRTNLEQLANVWHHANESGALNNLSPQDHRLGTNLALLASEISTLEQPPVEITRAVARWFEGHPRAQLAADEASKELGRSIGNAPRWLVLGEVARRVLEALSGYEISL